MPKFVVAACQMLCGEDKAANIQSAEEAVKAAAKAGAKVCLCRHMFRELLLRASDSVWLICLGTLSSGVAIRKLDCLSIDGTLLL